MASTWKDAMSARLRPRFFELLEPQPPSLGLRAALHVFCRGKMDIFNLRARLIMFGNYRVWDIDWRSPQLKRDLSATRSRGERAQNEVPPDSGATRSGARESARQPRSLQSRSHAADTSRAAPSPHLSLPHTPQTRAHASRAARTVNREPDPRRSRSRLISLAGDGQYHTGT